ncbi:unnamed protein product [Clonostachys rosea]|uniref:Prolyl 4-hydroxylase alpha subunit Fe(2+) 2OG dioxygenase domain-containing protein n=1 Tax=Bionectria ochroleuca TaxID=29856 RepID=A0ABY6ULD2_BIOOC|nr:unnamed protein product [Clonostachys rosea]
MANSFTERVSGPTRQNDSDQDVALDETAEQGDFCARWCTVHQDGSFSIDESKIKCSLPREKRENLALMQLYLRGLARTAELYPLIFDGQNMDSHTPESIRFRSLTFFQDLVSNPGLGAAKLEALESSQKLIFATGLRDLFIADYHGLLVEHERKLLKELVEIVREPLDSIYMNGIMLSFHPSADFTCVKFIEDLDTKTKRGNIQSFIRCLSRPRIFVVFVRAADLSFHNYENIVHLDSWLETSMADHGQGDLSTSLSESTQSSTRHEIYTCKLQDKTTSALLDSLSTLNLYVPPMNKETRGGDRFIFHSSILSKALTNAVRSSGMLDKIENGSLSSSFEFVNYIFRYNRFASGDSKFESHLDTPYYDAARSHVSKYTLLIYITGGHNNPLLRINDVSFNEVEEMTCIIFNQSYEHEGRPFVNGSKIFLRTELIFRDTNLQHDPTIGRIFSEACYMTSQSVFDQDPSLSLHAHECFERANSLHWSLEKAASHQSVYLWKQFQGMNFVTNGYSYWFDKNTGTDVKDCAVVAMLDYLNCKVGSRPFRSRCASKKIEKKISNDEVWTFLSSNKRNSAKGFRRLTEASVDSLLEGPSKPFMGRLDEWEGEEDELPEFEQDGHGCCPMHSFPMFNPSKSIEVMECYDLCRGYSRKKLLGAPLLLLGSSVTINDANIKIVGDKVFILKDSQQSPLPPINFAACWGGEPMPPEFVVVGSEIPAPDLLLPPIPFHECREGYQLSLDFFRNDWMVRVDDKRTIPIPDLTEKPEDETPFSEKIPETADGMEKMFGYFG